MISYGKRRFIKYCDRCRKPFQPYGRTAKYCLDCRQERLKVGTAKTIITKRTGKEFKSIRWRIEGRFK